MTVRTRKIDELKDVHLRIRSYELFTMQTIFIDHNHFAWIYITDKICAHCLKCACFRGKYKTSVQCRDRERANAAFIAYCNKLIFRHDEDRKRTCHERIRFLNCFLKRSALFDEDANCFCYHPRVGKFFSFYLLAVQKFFKSDRARKIAVMCESYAPIAHDRRLCMVYVRTASRRISIMSYGNMSVNFCITSSENTCETSPMPLLHAMRSPPSEVAMPELSCPRCWSANKPKNVIRDTSNPRPKTPNTPHFSPKSDIMFNSSKEY